MDEYQQRKLFVAVAQTIAMKALERPPEQRQIFIEATITKIREGYERKHGTASDTAVQAATLLNLTKAMLKILEESGGQIGHA